MSGWSECVRTSVGRGPCCVTCCSTSRMAELASSGSANRLQCETPNFLLVTQCVIDKLAKSCSPETLTSVVTLGTSAEMNRADICITVHPTSTSVSVVFLVPLNVPLLLCFPTMGVIQVLLMILPQQILNAMRLIFGWRSGVRVVNKAQRCCV